MELKEFAYVAQALAVAFAVLVGGGWTLFRYFSLRSIQQAKAGLEKTRIELEKEQRNLQERGIVNVSLRAEQLFSGNDYLISIYVTLKNMGNGTEVLDWSKSFMGATKVVCKSDGSVGFSGAPIMCHQPGVIADTTLAPGETNYYSFLIRVPDFGIYHLRFGVTCSLQATQLIDEEREQAGMNEPGDLVWATDLYFQVKDVGNQEADR